MMAEEPKDRAPPAPEVSDPAPPDAAADPEPEPSDGPAAAPPSPPDDWETRFKYLLADFDNFRRRSDREAQRVQQAARAKLLQALLPLWEAFERADPAIRKLPAKDPLRSGLELLQREWEQFLRAAHVEPVARVGDPFRPDDQEAVAETAPTGEIREGRVAEIVQQGYRSDVGLLRPAKVVVARRSAPATEDLPTAATGEGPE